MIELLFRVGWGVCPEELGVQGLRMEGLFQPEAFDHELLEMFVGLLVPEVMILGWILHVK